MLSQLSKLTIKKTTTTASIILMQNSFNKSLVSMASPMLQQTLEEDEFDNEFNERQQLLRVMEKPSIVQKPRIEKMSASEAFVETMAQRQVKYVFGIVGSAYIDALDLFPAAGIKFLDVKHEQNAVHMADGYARISGKHGVVIAQNGPGVTNFVTGIASAFWNHAPVVAVTPEAGSVTKGLGGFQETDQMPIFSKITKYQVHVDVSSRMSELTGRAFDRAMIENGPTQLNIPRDKFYEVCDFKIRDPVIPLPSAGNVDDVQRAAIRIMQAEKPVLLVGAGVGLSENGIKYVQEISEKLGIPVATTYLHNDSFPSSHPNYVGPLGYMGSKAAMNLVKESDLIIAIGTRLNPFGTTPQYGMKYWDNEKPLIQIEKDATRLGLSCDPEIAIHGDAGETSKLLNAFISNMPGHMFNDERRLQNIKNFQLHKSKWEMELKEKSENSFFPEGGLKGQAPRKYLSKLSNIMPKDIIVSTDIGNICSTSNSYLKFDRPRSFLPAGTFGSCGYAVAAAMGARLAAPERPVVAISGDGAFMMNSINELITCAQEKIGITILVMRNEIWGAECLNQVIWCDDRYIGSTLEGNPSIAKIATSMGVQAHTIYNTEEFESAFNQSIQDQADGKTTVLEVVCTKELSDPFRSDAMKLPQRVLSKYSHLSVPELSSTRQFREDKR